jgi:hypothetical protein
MRLALLNIIKCIITSNKAGILCGSCYQSKSAANFAVDGGAAAAATAVAAAVATVLLLLLLLCCCCMVVQRHVSG